MMKIFRYLLLAVLFLGYRAIAHAYAVVINDPTTPTFNPIFDVQPGVPFSFNFQPCNQVLGGVTYTGCAEGKNDSKVTLTSIILSYSDTGLGNPTCTSDAFDKITCGPSSNGEFVLSFIDHPPSDDNGCDGDADSDDVGCGIPAGHYFYIYENAPGTIPTVDGIANTPEPGSIWLALSGLGSAGYLIRRRRKNLTV